MVWPFSASDRIPSETPSSSTQPGMQSFSNTEQVMTDKMGVSGFDNTFDGDMNAASVAAFDKSSIFALDQLKQAGVPIQKQLSPYLQMDPNVFRETTPQYIVPGESKGDLEFAMGRIGWAVLGGYAVGCMCGLLPELRNPDTRQLPFKPFVTRLVNASVKHGSGFAHPAGSIVFMFSVADLILGKLRAKDDLNAIGAGAITGALFRSAHGTNASLVGAGIGAAAALAWLFSDRDSRDRLWEMQRRLLGQLEYNK